MRRSDTLVRPPSISSWTSGSTNGVVALFLLILPLGVLAAHRLSRASNCPSRTQQCSPKSNHGSAGPHGYGLQSLLPRPPPPGTSIETRSLTLSPWDSDTRRRRRTFTALLSSQRPRARHGRTRRTLLATSQVLDTILDTETRYDRRLADPSTSRRPRAQLRRTAEPMKGRFRVVSCGARREREACRRSGQDAPARACAGGTRSKVRRVLPRIFSQCTAADYTGEWRTYTWKTTSHSRSDRSRT